MAAGETLRLEAEEGTTTGDLRWRSSASNEAAIYLNHGESTSNSFDTRAVCSVEVINVRYSEGSAVDTVTVSINGQNIGSFRTSASSNSVDPWNDFHNSGRVGARTTLAAGTHTVMVTVSAIDEYGMEVDYIQLDTSCENTIEEPSAPTGSDSEPEDNEPRSLTVGEITGIIMAIIALIGLMIATVPLCLKFVR